VMSLFNIQARDMMTAVDGITSVVTNSKFSIEDYALALAQGGGVAASVGVGFEDFNTTIAGIAPLFSSGSDAGTSFKTFLQRLIPQSKDAKKAMMELGIITADGSNRFFDASGNMRSMAEITGILHEATKGLSEEQKNQAFSTIFGTDAMRAAFGIANMTEAEFRQLQATMGQTSAADSAATRMDNLTGSMEILDGVLETVRVRVGEKFLPVVRRLVDTLTSLVEENADGIVGFFEGMATGIDGLMGRLDTFNFLVENGIEPITALKTVLGTLVPPEAMSILSPLIDGVASLADKANRAADALSTFSFLTENGIEPVEAMKIALGTLMPQETVDALFNGATAVGDFVGGIVSFVEQNPREIEGVLLGIGVALGILALHSGISTGMTLLAAGLGAVSAAGGITTLVMTGLTGVLGTITGLLTILASPIVLLAVLVGVLAAAWYTNFGNIRGNTMLIVNILKHYFTETIPAAFETLKQAAFILKVKWGEFWEAIGGKLESIWQNVIQPIVSRITGAINGALAALDKLSGAGGGGGDKNTSPLAKPGANARGTNFWGGGLTWVGEDGPELLNLPSGTRITDAQSSQRVAAQMGGGTTTIQNTFYVNSELDLEMVAVRVTQIQKENA
jgi:hypothetical protein